MWTAFALAAVLLLLGVMVDRFKMYFLISGYNTMSPVKREKVDIEKVARLMGRWAYATAAMLVVLGLSIEYGSDVGVVASLTVIGAATVYMLLRAQRYDGNIYDDTGALRPGGWKWMAVVVVVLIALVAGLVALAVALVA